MPDIASLQREERIGLGIAVVLHGAVAAALIVQATDDVDTIPVPERMTVSLADEIALESTSPAPAAQPQAPAAPVFGDDTLPEPVSSPVEQAIADPVDVATPTPAPTPTPTPTPRRTPPKQETRTPPKQETRTPPKKETRTPPKKESGSSRFDEAFSEGTGSASNSSATPAATFGPREQAALSQAINRQLKRHWRAPQGVDADKLVTILSWNLNQDGSVAGPIRVVRQDGINDSNRPQAARHAEQAKRAVQLAAPFNLPPQFYNEWKRIRSWRFDRRL